MKEEITISKEWLEHLVELVDRIAKEDDEVLKHAWFSHLLGYVHSLDVYLKK